MKKSLFTFAAALLALSSCSSEEELFTVENDSPTRVSVNIAVPGSEPATRVTDDEANIPGKGHMITKFEYAIFDSADNLVISSNDHKGGGGIAPDIAKADVDDHGHFTLEVTLMKQHTYTFYVWASSESADCPYSFNPATKTVSVDYSKMKANDENMDAFFGKHVFTIADEQTATDQYTIILNRPFAQLNIMTNDVEYTQSIMKTGTISSIDVEVLQNPGTYSTLDLSNYIASNATGNQKFHADFPNGWEDLVHAGDGDVARYYYLATCYIMTGVDTNVSYYDQLNGGVGTEKEVTDLKITISYTDGSTVEFTKTNIPIRRSWRTNIYGNLQTSEADSNCRIDFNFAGGFKDGPGADEQSYGPDDGDHSGDDNSNNDTID